MIVAVIAAAVLLTVAALLALVRVERGPSMLDRAVALDALTITLVGAIAVEAIWSRRTETIPILVALSMVGFVGSVTMARFAAKEPESEGAPHSREEVAAQARAADVPRGEQRGGPRGAETDDEGSTDR
ncbi:MrpF/PhaF family protein [Isoptericola sp. 4D.3]|jgi:multicomponent Na+:H+ antiporter subunit F|uniref:MrpF/PhaF family protein n=1 Tax=Isoptericola peretonis TaxID=2918523 RepID=A0ABT0J9A6_9MICO|nr:MrpF/PhaF family protein [Isoptericola sp. 4D.3]